jgi:ABC-type transport system substrate-binding protein
MNRFVLLVCATSVMLASALVHAQPTKVLRYAFPIAETGFDPAQISDLYSRTIAQGIFEAPLTYDYLARPAMVKPQTASALPEANADFTRFTFRIKPGIYFADDPVFKGVRRELTAADYVYSVKRHYDPKFKSPSLFQLENARILGLAELRKKVIADKAPFPYDIEVEGLRALDRYTFEVRLAQPSPRFHYHFADAAVTGAVAREVMEAYAGKEMEHPVGTGPFRLASWKRSSKIVLERNPGYRDVVYDETPAADHPQAQALAVRFKGRKLPMVDRVEISIIEETQPRWLAFLNGEHDMIDRLPNEFASVATPNGKLAPNLAKQGMQMERVPLVDLAHFYFGMDNPVVGGYTPERVALRRALALAYDGRREIDVVRYGQAIPAQAVIAPMTSGYDPALKTEMSDHDVARAKALLDLHGYVDQNGDGWRDQPGGVALVLEYSSQPDQLSRKLQEVLKKSFDAVNVKIEFKIAKWPEQLKSSRAGKLMMWGSGWGGANPDGQYFLDILYGPNKGQANHARFDLPAFNALYEKQSVLPDGPEREAVIREAKLLAVAYMPYKMTAHRIATDLMHAPLVGYQRHPFMREWWRYVDIDTQELARHKP